MYNKYSLPIQFKKNSSCVTIYPIHQKYQNDLFYKIAICLFLQKSVKQKLLFYYGLKVENKIWLKIRFVFSSHLTL